MKMSDEIQIIDWNGEVVLRYWKVDDNYYFGGFTSDIYRKWEIGPHVWKPLEGLLDTIAQFAKPENKLRYSYQVRGHFQLQNIERQMDARVLAKILDADEKKIVDYYGRLITVISRDNLERHEI